MTDKNTNTVNSLSGSTTNISSSGKKESVPTVRSLRASTISRRRIRARMDATAELVRLAFACEESRLNVEEFENSSDGMIHLSKSYGDAVAEHSENVAEWQNTMDDLREI